MKENNSSIVKRGIFVTGTDTEVGKTLVCSLLVSALSQLKAQNKFSNHLSSSDLIGYFKPIQTGMDLDSPTVASFNSHASVLFPPSTYLLKAPMAPHRAALLEQIEIQLDEVKKDWNQIQAGTWVVEGAGGLLVPLNSRQTIRELIEFLDLPLLIVASSRLGTLNHILLTIEAAKKKDLKIAGIILNGDDDPELESYLAQLTDAPVLARVPFLHSVTPEHIQRIGATLFSQSVLNKIFNFSSSSGSSSSPNSDSNFSSGAPV